MEKSYKPSKYNMFMEVGGKKLVFNALRRSLAIWDEEDTAVYESRGANGGGQSLDELVQGGFLIDEDADELRSLREVYSMLRFGRHNMAMTIAPTLMCNFACDYCYQGNGAGAQTMSEAVFSRLLDFLRSRKSLRRLHIAWYGGEPLLEKELICGMSDELMALCAEKQTAYSASMVTNGYFLSGDTAERLAGKMVRSIQVTLDGSRETHDARRVKKDGSPTFDRILGNIKEALERPGVNIVVRVNIDRRNSEKIHALLDCLSAEGLGGRENFGVYFAPVDVCSAECTRIAGSVLTRAEYAETEMALLRRAVDLELARPQLPGSLMGMCAAIKPNGFVVLPNGDVHKCWNTVSDPALRVCTVDGLEEAAEKTEGEWLSWSPFMLQNCQECEILPLCAGACANRAMLGNAEPCISLKENIREKIMLYALHGGAATEQDYRRFLKTGK